MPNKSPLLPEPMFSQHPPCPRCGTTAIVSRMTPAGEQGRYMRTFECPKCEASFETTDESDAEIQQLAERITGTAKPLL